jgi:hypothetical protein
MDFLFGYFPLGYNTSFLMLVGGFLFGYFLEVGELGSPRKLNAQFTFNDWTVFKVMFVAIVVAAAGIWLLAELDWLLMDALKIPTPYYLAMMLGGMLLGAGLAVGGYCPGTSVVGLFTGRLDSLLFMLGMLSGIILFALSFFWIKPLFLTAAGLDRQTLSQLTGLPVWAILLILFAIAVIGFRLGSWFETRSHGPLSASDLIK